jgi:hypothetical protein
MVFLATRAIADKTAHGGGLIAGWMLLLASDEEVRAFQDATST